MKTSNKISSNFFDQLFIQWKTVVFTYRIVSLLLFINVEFSRDVTHGFLLYVTLVMSFFTLFMMSRILSSLLTTGNFILQMSPLERTSLSFNDVNSFNPFLDPCGGLWTKFEEYCYHVNGDEKTEEEAQQYCDKEMDANLAKINSQEENSFVLDLANKHAPSATQVWIGLMWEENPKDFYWYDHSVPTFKYWAPQEPNGKASEPCVVMFVGRDERLPIRASGYWNDVRCNEQSATVCKRLY